jgi:hypothetical protein
MNNIYVTSWGYDMTINDYIKVLENNGKTAKVVKIGMKVVDDNGRGNGRSYPDETRIVGEPFRLRVKKYGEGDIVLRGSYPFTDGSTSKRSGTFYKYSGKGDYYNTWD